MGVAAFEALQPEQLQQPAGPTGVLSPPQPEAGVLPGIEVGEQGVVLEHHAHAPAFWFQPAAFAGHQASVDQHRAPLGPLKAGDQAQQGGFAAAGGAEEPHQLALVQGQIDSLQGPFAWRGVGVTVPDPPELHVLAQRQLGRQ